MINYKIEGGSLPVVICYPEAGQTLCTESGSMSWMSPNMEMKTNSGGGLKKALGAKKRRIRSQFLTEAVILSVIGGILGVIAGIILARVISMVALIPVAISIR